MDSTDGRLLSFTFAAHTLVHSLVSSIPLFIPIWLTQFEVTRYQAGLVVTLLIGLYGVMALPSGTLSDRYGSDRLVVAFLLGTGVVIPATLLIDDFTSVALVLGLVGMCAGLYHPPALSLISRQSSSPGTALAYHGLGANVGNGIGPLVVALALVYVSWETVLALFSLPLLLVGFLFLRWGPRDDRRGTVETTERRFRADLGSLVTAAFVLILLTYVFRGIYYRGTITFLPDFLDVVATLPALTVFGESIPASRWVYSAILLVGSIGQVAGGKLGDRIGGEITLIGVFVLTIVALWTFGRLSGGALLVGSLVLGVLLFAAGPLLQKLVADHTPTANRGMGFGVLFGVNLGIGGLGAGLAGWLVTTGDYRLMFSVLAFLPIGAIVTVALIRYDIRIRRLLRSRA